MPSRCLLLFVLSVLVGCGDGKQEESSPSRPSTSNNTDTTDTAGTDTKVSPKPKDADATIETDPTEDGNEQGDRQNIDSPTPVENSDDCIDADEFTCAVEVAITRYSNELRSPDSPLAHHGRLSYTARAWSIQQAVTGSISHLGFPSARLQTYAAAFQGAKINILAENVAMATSSSTSADAVAKLFVNMWANSSGHRRNILGNYSVLGVGISRKGNFFYATQIFGTE